MPLTLLDLQMDMRGPREIQRYRDLAILHMPERPLIDPVANAIALFITEFLDRILRTSEGDRQLFAFVANEIRRLEELSPNDLTSFHLDFLLRLSSHLGIVPNSDDYREGMVLDIEEGTFRHARSIKEAREEAPVATLLYRMLVRPKGDEPFPMNRYDRNALLALIIRYFDNYFPGMSHLKSPAVLTELFSD